MYNDDYPNGSSYGRNNRYRDDAADSANLTNALKENVHSDAESGELQFFGKKFNVGQTAATLLDPLVIWATTLIYQKGGTKGREWLTAAAKGLKASDATAAKWGVAGELLVRVGGPVLQFSTDIKKTVTDAYTGMNGLKQDASVLLAANDGNVLTSNFTALAHKRALVYEQGKRNVMGSVLSAVRQAPAFLAGYNQYHLDRIENPKLAVDSMPAGATAAEKHATWSKYHKMKTSYMERAELVRVGRTDPGVIRAREAEKAALDALQNEGTAYSYDKRETLRQATRNKEAAYASALGKTHSGMKKPSDIPDELQDNPLVRSVSWLFNDDARRSMSKPRSEADFRRNIANTQLLPPALAFGVNAARKNFVGKDQDKVVAWDMIKELEQYVQQEKHPDTDRVNVYVKDIFAQQARDLGRKYELEGKSYDNAVEAVTNAIIYKKLPVQALAEVLDNKKIVAFGAKDANFGDLEDINKELSALKSKYTAKVSEQEFYKDSSFTKQDVVKTFKGIPEDEKPFFALLFPPGILEKAGVDKDEVKKYRDQGRRYFVDQLTDMARFMIAAGHDELKNQGVKSKYLDELEAFEQNFQRADRMGSGREYVKQNLEDTTETVRNVIASAKKPGELWKDFVARNSERDPAAIQPKTVLDHVQRESGDQARLIS